MLVSSYAQRAPLHATRQRFVIVNTLSGIAFEQPYIEYDAEYEKTVAS